MNDNKKLENDEVSGLDIYVQSDSYASVNNNANISSFKVKESPHISPPMHIEFLGSSVIIGK